MEFIALVPHLSPSFGQGQNRSDSMPTRARISLAGGARPAMPATAPIAPPIAPETNTRKQNERRPHRRRCQQEACPTRGRRGRYPRRPQRLGNGPDLKNRTLGGGRYYARARGIFRSSIPSSGPARSCDRVMLGGLFALALLAVGEVARRKESLSSIAPLPIANIPAILTAAGTAVAFATVYAAYALYGFLAPPVAFVMLGAVALGTLAAALLHGPALAGLGVVGAFVTPVLVSSDKPDYWALYIYIAIVTAAAFALARIRCGAGFLPSQPSCSARSDGGRHREHRNIRTTCLPHDRRLCACGSHVVAGFMFGPTAGAGPHRTGVVLARCVPSPDRWCWCSPIIMPTQR